MSQCEDDKFLSCLDKSVNGNISDSSNHSRDKNLMISPTAPVFTVKGTKTWDQLLEERESEAFQVRNQKIDNSKSIFTVKGNS